MISIIYLTRNRSTISKKNLNLLLNTPTKHEFDVHIVNNGSTDDTYEWLGKLDHPRIASVIHNMDNEGIGPVVNNFWKTCTSEFLGKIDDDISVPPTWMDEIMLRQTNPIVDKVGPVTLYHWINEWKDDVAEGRLPLRSTSSGAKIALSSHTGGNYIMHRSLVDKYGGVPVTQGPKGGFTTWQMLLPKDVAKGYVYPLLCFTQDAFEYSWTAYKDGKLDKVNREYLEYERKEATRLLTLKGLS